MTKDQAFRAAGWTAALIFVAVLIVLLAQVMPGRWSVAFWAMIAAVLATELAAKTVFKRQLAQNRALEMVLDIASMAVAVIGCYLFARHFYPGAP
jgi:hypothetical protein